jgi:hypothetical protein
MQALNQGNQPDEGQIPQPVQVKERLIEQKIGRGKIIGISKDFSPLNSVFLV